MANRVNTAMILAAGLGTRMRPLTNTIPKPLVKVGNITLFDRILDKVLAAGCQNVVVNVHYLADVMRQHLADEKRVNIHTSEETELLETGGGILQALPLLGNHPFFAINGDSLWLDDTTPALSRLANAWRDDMDALLMLYPTDKATHFDGSGDFFMEPGGQLRRRGDQASAPYIYTGVQLLHPRLFHSAAPGRFSLNVLYDQAIAQRRLSGLVHDGAWYHVSTPEDVTRTGEALANSVFAFL